MATKVYPYRNMRHTHPYKIWAVLQRMRVLHKLNDTAPVAYDAHTISASLFSNWNDLTPSEQETVILAKLHLPLLMLRIERWITAEFEIDEEIGKTIAERWKVDKNAFEGINGISYSEVIRLTESSIDEDWETWRGRRKRHG